MQIASHSYYFIVGLKDETLKVTSLRTNSFITLETLEPTISYFFQPVFSMTIKPIREQRTKVTFQFYFSKKSMLFQVSNKQIQSLKPFLHFFEKF